MREQERTRREMRAAYARLGSIANVAQEFGVAFETARQRLRAAGVELRPPGRPSAGANDTPVEDLVDSYRKGQSVAAIAETIGVSPNTVRNRLLAAGVVLRPRPGWKY